MRFPGPKLDITGFFVFQLLASGQEGDQTIILGEMLNIHALHPRGGCSETEEPVLDRVEMAYGCFALLNLSAQERYAPNFVLWDDVTVLCVKGIDFPNKGF